MAPAADHAFNESDDTFRQLAENITDVFWIRSPDMRTVHYVSPAFERMWGRSVASLYANPGLWPTFIHPEDRQRVAETFATLLGDAPSLELEYRILRPDGEVRWVHVRGFQIRDATRALVRHAGVVTDITERKHAELELDRTNRSLRMLSRCNEAVIRAQDEPTLLGRICRIAVEEGGCHKAIIEYAPEHADGELCVMAQAGADHGTQSVIRLPLRHADHLLGELQLHLATGPQPLSVEPAVLQAMADNVALGVGNLRAQAETRRLQAAVVSVAAGVSGATGTPFFEQLAVNMAEALDAQAVFVARWLPSSPPTARTIAAVVDGAVTGNLDFLIDGSPCESLADGDTCIVSGPQASLFPDAPLLAGVCAQTAVGHRLTSSSGQLLGLLLVLFRAPVQHPGFTSSTLRIFAARAASEMERQHTDAQVREQAALLDVAHDAILVKDLDGRILYWNKGAERLYGWTAAEVLGREAVHLLDKDAARFAEAHAAILTRGEWQGEVARLTKQGRDIIVEARWTLVRDSLGRPSSILAINTDVTAKKRLESEFLRAQRMEGIGTLAGGIAHDLNNVFAPILMSIEMLKGAVTTDDDRAVLATLDGSAQRGAELVKQVLSYARGVEGQRIPLDPLHVMRDLVNVMRDTFPKSVEVRFTPPQHLWPVRGDPSQLHQVFLNLCVNARDAMPGGGALAITMRNVVLAKEDAELNPDARPGPFVVVEVADTGVGIADGTRDRIFEPFFTTREIGKGTGLGLSTTMAIVQSHGGFIHLYSEVGLGSTFSVYLPAATTKTSRPEAPVEPAAPPGGNGELVLLVDDEEAIRRVAQRLLERAGYRVVTARDGADALRVYADHHADIAVVLTDMAMPVMDGQALVAALRVIDPGVRVIGSSGLVPVGGFGAVGEYFISKPYTALRLMQAVHAVLQGSPSRAG
jgi:PAS domain S-box-containing protein